MHKNKVFQIEEDADTFDQDLYELVLRAARFEREGIRGWKAIANQLNHVRPKVRVFMHPDDRKGTEGA